MGALLGRLGGPLADGLRVATQVADGRVDLGQGQSHLRHGLEFIRAGTRRRLEPTSRCAGTRRRLEPTSRGASTLEGLPN